MTLTYNVSVTSLSNCVILHMEFSGARRIKDATVGAQSVLGPLGAAASQSGARERARFQHLHPDEECEHRCWPESEPPALRLRSRRGCRSEHLRRHDCLEGRRGPPHTVAQRQGTDREVRLRASSRRRNERPPAACASSRGGWSTHPNPFAKDHLPCAALSVQLRFVTSFLS